MSHIVKKIVPFALALGAATGCDDAAEPVFGSETLTPVVAEATWVAPYQQPVFSLFVEPDRGDVTMIDGVGVTRLDADGAMLFSHSAQEGAWIATLAYTPQGTTIMTGDCFSPATFAGTPVCQDVDPQTGGARTFLVELDRQGATLRSRELAGGAQVDTQAIRVGEDGRVHIAGTFNGIVDLGDGELETKTTSIFYLQLDEAWETRLSRNFGADSGRVNDVALEPSSGDVFLIGTFTGVARFSGINLTNGPSGQAIFLTRLSEDAEPRWAHHHLGGGQFTARFDTDGGLLVSGAGYAPFTSLGGDQVIDGPFASKLDSAGEHVWTWRAQDEQHTGTATVDSAGRIVALYTDRRLVREAVEPAPDCWDYYGYDEYRAECEYQPAEYLSTRLLRVVSPEGQSLGGMTLSTSTDEYGYYGNVALAAGPDGSILAAVGQSDQGVDFGTGPQFGATVLAKLQLVAE